MAIRKENISRKIGALSINLEIGDFNDKQIIFIKKESPRGYNTSIAKKLKYFLDLSDSLRGAIDNHDLLLAVLGEP